MEAVEVTQVGKMGRPLRSGSPARPAGQGRPSYKWPPFYLSRRPKSLALWKCASPGTPIIQTREPGSLVERGTPLASGCFAYRKISASPDAIDRDHLTVDPFAVRDDSIATIAAMSSLLPKRIAGVCLCMSWAIVSGNVSSTAGVMI